MASLMVVLLGLALMAGVSAEITRFTDEDFSSLQTDIKDLAQDVRDLTSLMRKLVQAGTIENTMDKELSIMNGTIEERVTLLELQVGDLGDDLEAVEDEVTIISSDLIIISSDQILQDQRIIELEIDADGFEDSIEDLIATDVSVNLELESMDATLVNLEDRMQAQEVAGAVAFQAEIGVYSSIPEESVVLFGTVDLNLGDGFDISTGEFTVPSGGAGLYYFRFGYMSDLGEYSHLYIRVNGGYICRAHIDINSSGANDRENSSCAAVVTLVEGDLVDVYYDQGTDDTPVYSSNILDNTFTGFRIASE